MLSEHPEDNWERLRAALDEDGLRPQRDTVLLVDGDRTLTREDTSRLFLERAGLPLAPIKDAFARHGYSYPGFRFHARYYLQAGAAFPRMCQEVAEAVALYDGAAAFLGRALALADVYLVTAGVTPIWSALLARAGLPAVRVLGGVYPGARYLIGREEKGRIAQHLRTPGRRLIGFGDSDVDSLMLQAAHQAVVVVNHRGNQDLLPHLGAHPAVAQIALGALVHPGLPRIDFHAAHQILTQGA